MHAKIYNYTHKAPKIQSQSRQNHGVRTLFATKYSNTALRTVIYGEKNEFDCSVLKIEDSRRRDTIRVVADAES